MVSKHFDDDDDLADSCRCKMFTKVVQVSDIVAVVAILAIVTCCQNKLTQSLRDVVPIMSFFAMACQIDKGLNFLLYFFVLSLAPRRNPHPSTP